MNTRQSLVQSGCLSSACILHKSQAIGTLRSCFASVLYIILFSTYVSNTFLLCICVIHYTFLWICFVYIFVLASFFYIILFSEYVSYTFSTLHLFFYTFCISASLLCIFCTLLSITCTRTLLCIFVLSIFYFAVSLSKHFRALPCFTVIFCYTYLML